MKSSPFSNHHLYVQRTDETEPFFLFLRDGVNSLDVLEEHLPAAAYGAIAKAFVRSLHQDLPRSIGLYG